MTISGPSLSIHLNLDKLRRVLLAENLTFQERITQGTEWIAPCSNLFDSQDRQGLNLPQVSRAKGGSLEETHADSQAAPPRLVGGRQPGVCRGDSEADGQRNKHHKHKSSTGQVSCNSAFQTGACDLSVGGGDVCTRPQVKHDTLPGVSVLKSS